MGKIIKVGGKRFEIVDKNDITQEMEDEQLHKEFGFQPSTAIPRNLRTHAEPWRGNRHPRLLL